MCRFGVGTACPAEVPGRGVLGQLLLLGAVLASSSCSVLWGRRARRCHDFTQQPEKGTRSAHSRSRAAACCMLTHSPSHSLFPLHLWCRAALQRAVSGKAKLSTSSGSLIQTSVISQLSWKATSWPVGATRGRAEGMCSSPQSSAR